jgi:hypothetical protein
MLVTIGADGLLQKLQKLSTRQGVGEPLQCLYDHFRPIVPFHP